MEKALIVEPGKCSGCGICELICASTHYNEYNPTKAYIRIYRNREMCVFIPMLSVRCDLCHGKLMCAKWCPEKVLTFLPWEEVAKRRKQMDLGKFPAAYFGE